MISPDEVQQIVQQLMNMNQQLNDMNQRLDDMNQQFDRLNQRVDGLNQQVNHQNQQNWTVVEKNAMYKSINKQLGLEEPLHALMDDNGNRPNGFPATKLISTDLTEQQLNSFLEFYKLDLEGNHSEKLLRLGDFIGVKYLK